MSGLLEAFRQGYLASNEAFNRHDFATAFAALPDDAVWETIQEGIGVGPMHGKRAIIDGFVELLEEWPDWRVDVLEITEPLPGLIHVLMVGSGTGANSGIRTERRVRQEWDYRGPSLRIREYSAD